MPECEFAAWNRGIRERIGFIYFLDLPKLETNYHELPLNKKKVPAGKSSQLRLVQFAEGNSVYREG